MKTDTYAVESNVHFPTDINLLWDSARKCLDTMEWIGKDYAVPGWRKHRYWRKVIKRTYRRTANIHQKKGKDYVERLQAAARNYLHYSRELSRRVKQGRQSLLSFAIGDIQLAASLEALRYYHEMLDKHVDLLERRVLHGEVIPHEEKVFSIFEPHVECLPAAGRDTERQAESEGRVGAQCPDHDGSISFYRGP